MGSNSRVRAVRARRGSAGRCIRTLLEDIERSYPF